MEFTEFPTNGSSHIWKTAGRNALLTGRFPKNVVLSAEFLHTYTCPILSQAYRRKRLFTIGNIYFARIKLRADRLRKT
jgi:hypothetical protein